jgi:hypothetical protein
MSVFTPTKMPVPSWMKMNDVLIAYETRMDDAENTIEKFSEEERIKNKCKYIHNWNPRTTQRMPQSPCNIDAVARPELKLKHVACNETSGNPKFTQPMYGGVASGCDMYNFDSTVNGKGKIFPEYAYCLQPGGMNNANCQIACYAFPDQKGCESIKAMNLTEAQRRSKIQAIKRLPPAPGPSPAPAPETKVVVDASIKTVTPGTVAVSFTDPKTKKPTVVSKSLVDMYKPSEKVSVIISSPSGTFLGINKK